MKLRAAGIVDGHDLAHLVGDFQTLAGPDHKRPSDRTFAAYFMVADGFAIQLRIDPHSQETEAFRASPPNRRGILAHPPREHERVEPIHCRSHPGDPGAK